MKPSTKEFSRRFEGDHYEQLGYELMGQLFRGRSYLDVGILVGVWLLSLLLSHCLAVDRSVAALHGWPHLLVCSLLLDAFFSAVPFRLLVAHSPLVSDRSPMFPVRWGRGRWVGTL